MASSGETEKDSLLFGHSKLKYKTTILSFSPRVDGVSKKIENTENQVHARSEEISPSLRIGESSIEHSRTKTCETCEKQKTEDKKFISVVAKGEDDFKACETNDQNSVVEARLKPKSREEEEEECKAETEIIGGEKDHIKIKKTQKVTSASVKLDFADGKYRSEGLFDERSTSEVKLEESNVSPARSTKRKRIEKSNNEGSLFLNNFSDEAKSNSKVTSVASLPATKKRNINSEITKDVPDNTIEETSIIKGVAPSLDAYLSPGGVNYFRPRLEWLNSPIQSSSSEEEKDKSNGDVDDISAIVGASINNSRLKLKIYGSKESSKFPSNCATDKFQRAIFVKPHSTFGEDSDTALHLAIRKGNTLAALDLIQSGAPFQAKNTKQVTPLILASQRGYLSVVESLLLKGADPLSSSATGSTALLQASHFGYVKVVELLLRYGANIEAANHKDTTPLMRAAQEGHINVVRFLLKNDACVNRINKEQMTALMLASQRGHHLIVQQLLDHGADADAMTAQNSTSLMLACKRRKIDVARVLLTAGCEMFLKDQRKRTARDLMMRHLKTARDDAARKESVEILKILHPTKQIEFMRMKSRVHLNSAMMKMWTLLQQDRASIPVSPAKYGSSYVSIHKISHDKDPVFASSDTALLRTMTLPAPLVGLISSFIPPSYLWDERLNLLTQRCHVDPDAAISCIFDLIDEVLEKGGFLEACRMANISPPSPFETWEEWRRWGILHSHLDTKQPPSRRLNVLTASLSGMRRMHVEDDKGTKATEMNPRDLRRSACFLPMLAYRSTTLCTILTEPPFKMPRCTVKHLINVNDIQSACYRLGTRSIHFEATMAIELVMLASSVISWYNREIRD